MHTHLYRILHSPIIIMAIKKLAPHAHSTRPSPTIQPSNHPTNRPSNHPTTHPSIRQFGEDIHYRTHIPLVEPHLTPPGLPISPLLKPYCKLVPYCIHMMHTPHHPHLIPSKTLHTHLSDSLPTIHKNYRVVLYEIARQS